MLSVVIIYPVTLLKASTDAIIIQDYVENRAVKIISKLNAWEDSFVKLEYACSHSKFKLLNHKINDVNN